jgi:hypothetical protein
MLFNVVVYVDLLQTLNTTEMPASNGEELYHVTINVYRKDYDFLKTFGKDVDKSPSHLIRKLVREGVAKLGQARPSQDGRNHDRGY